LNWTKWKKATPCGTEYEVVGVEPLELARVGEEEDEGEDEEEEEEE
jgi:alpha-aminoadipate carrier protein LysW